jgi:hypothetical protein
MTDLESLPILDLFRLAGESVGSGEGDIRPVNELIRRHRELVGAARPVLAIADVAANANDRSTFLEREALRALLTKDVGRDD